MAIPKKIFYRWIGFGMVVLSLLSVSAVQAATVTWADGTVSGNWDDATKWSTGVVPTTTDDVVITNTNAAGITVYSATPAGTYDPIYFKSLTLNTGPTTSYFILDSAIGSGGDITDNGFYFAQATSIMNTIAGKLTITGTGAGLGTAGSYTPIRFTANEIDLENTVFADAEGNYGGGPGQNGDRDYTNGGGRGDAAYGGGGGNGGAGGNGRTGALGGVSAPCLANALHAGSGGGGGATGSGSEGGGLVELISNNTTTINALITAKGNNALVDAGAGSGGTIYLSAKTFLGTPVGLVANGGNGGVTGGGGGGGGCVVVAYQTTHSFNSSVVSVAGGLATNGGFTGVIGTLNFVQRPLAPTTLTVDTLATTADLTWISGGGAGTYYKVEMSDDGINYFNSATTSATNYTFTGLAPTTYYWFRVSSVADPIGRSSYVVFGPKITTADTLPVPTLSGPTATTINLAVHLGLNSPTDTFFVIKDQNFTGYDANGTPGAGDYLRLSQWGGVVRGLTPSTTYIFRVSPYVFDTYINGYVFASGSQSPSASSTTLLSAPSIPSFMGESSTTINLIWTANGNPTTTPYVVFSPTTNQYFTVTGTPSVTLPARYTLAAWNGAAKGLNPGTLYNFQVITVNENSTQIVTGTAGGSYTLNANGSAFSNGGGPVAGVTSTSTVTSSMGWYFGTPGAPSILPTSSTPFPVGLSTIPGTSQEVALLPNGTTITPQSVFQMMNNGYEYISAPTVSLFKGKNLNSNIVFSRLPTAVTALKVPTVLKLRYDYTNPNIKRIYHIERTLVSPLGKVIAISTLQRTIKQGEKITYTPSQALVKTLSPGLYTVKVRITSPNSKTVYDQNWFDMELGR